MKPTEAQLACLKLAARDAIRYYKGGWYSIPAVAGPDQHKPRDVFSVPSTHVGTLRACVKRGWLYWWAGHVEGNDETDIYGQSWAITEAGRAVLS